MRAVFVGAALFLADQGMKWAIRDAGRSLPFPGGELGTFPNAEWAFSLSNPIGNGLILAAFFTLILLTITAARHVARHGELGLILGGGVSNVMDRIAHGAVMDVIRIADVYFNVADVAIVAGCILILKKLWISGSQSKKEIGESMVK